jgi:ADP-ribose pyrophosphatase
MTSSRLALPAYPGLQIEREQLVWNGRFPLQLVTFRYRRFDGSQSGPLTWELWRRGRAAAMLPYDPVRDEVVLIEQFRLPGLAAGVDPVMTEVPAGLCNDGEDEATTIRRELREEIGLDADLVTPIGEFVLTPGGADEKLALFVGRVRAPAAGPDGVAGLGGLIAEQEDIRVRVRPALAAIEDAASGRLPNSVATIALLWLGLRRDRLRAEWLSVMTEGGIAEASELRDWTKS